MNNCWLIHPNLINNRVVRRTPEASLIELKSLAKAINLKLIYSDIVRLSIIKSGTFFGKGKIENIKLKLTEVDIEKCIIIINTM